MPRSVIVQRKRGQAQGYGTCETGSRKQEQCEATALPYVDRRTDHEGCPRKDRCWRNDGDGVQTAPREPSAVVPILKLQSLPSGCVVGVRILTEQHQPQKHAHSRHAAPATQPRQRSPSAQRKEEELPERSLKLSKRQKHRYRSPACRLR